LCRNRWQAQDLVQDAFAAAWNARQTLRDEGASKSWLFSILRNMHASIYQRKQLPTEEVELDDLGETAAAGGYERVELEQCLRILPQRYRAPLMLQVLGGFSGKEIAGMMGITEQNVMTRLCRARQALRRMVSAASNSRHMQGVKRWNV